MLNRMISLYLCMVILISMLPAQVFAADGAAEPAEQIAQTEAPTEQIEETDPTVSAEPTEETVVVEETVTEIMEATPVPAERADVQEANTAANSARAGNSTIGYTYDEATKTLTITGEGPMFDYFMNDGDRYGIYPPWYNYYPYAEKIVISEGITRVGNYSFYEPNHYCNNMKELVIADSVEEIGHAAFWYSYSLEKVTIGKNLKKVSENNFLGTYDLREVHIADLNAYCGIDYEDSCTLLAFPSSAYLYLNGEKITDLVVPDGITRIGKQAFLNCNLRSVTLPDSVVELGTSAFAGNPFTAFTIPSGVTHLQGTFENCTQLTSIVVPNNVAYIGENTFRSCSNLQSITLCGDVTEIGSSAFSDCLKLTTLTIPDTVSTIGHYAFSGCAALSEIRLPAALETLGNSVFKDCSSLKVLELPDSIVNIGEQAFMNCTALPTVMIPEKITQIPEEIFSGCSSLKTVTFLAEGVPISVGGKAFYNCTSLTDCEMPAGVASLEKYTFANCSALQTITFSESLEVIPENAFLGCSGMGKIEIPGSISTIQNEAFTGCTGLTEIVFLGDAPENIGKTAFKNVTATCYFPGDNQTYTPEICANSYGGDLTWRRSGDDSDSEWCGTHITWNLSDDGVLTLTGTGTMYDYPEEDILYAPWYDSRDAITQIIISDGVTEIGERAFYNCTKVTGVTIPRSIEVIGKQAFDNCSISSIVWPEQLTTIGAYAFRSAKFSGTLQIPEGVVSVGEGAFAECGSITAAVLPDSMTSIPDKMFYSCGKLVDVDFPNMITSIGYRAFTACYKLNSIVLTEGLVEIGEYAFAACGYTEYGGYSFNSVTLPSTVKVIGKYAFNSCQSLNSINLPEGLERIQEYTFHFCSSLGELVIPASVKVIESNAFEQCHKLFIIRFCGDAPEFGAKALRCTYKNSSDCMTAYYPANNPTWTEDVFQNYGGNVIWVPYEPSEGSEGSGGSGGEGTPGGDNEENGGNESGGDGDNSGNTGGGNTSGGDSGDGTGTGSGGSGNNFGSGGTGNACQNGHTLGQWQETKAPTCENDGEKRRYCSVCGGYEFVKIDALGHQEVIDAAQDATCTTPGLTEGKHCSVCSEVLTAQESVDAYGHSFGDWTPVEHENGTEPETEQRVCGTCSEMQTRVIGVENGLILDLPQYSAVWVDGVEYAAQTKGNITYVDLPDGDAKTMVTYSYYAGDESNLHTQYPVSMKVWILSWEEGIYTATYVEELDDILRYSGMSIRVTGKKGIRMITSIEKAKKNSLVSDGLAGFTLKEYGTVAAWTSQLGEGKPLLLGESYSKSNYAYKQGKADPVFAYDGNLMQYTNVLTGFSNAQCKNDLALRPYMILADADGNEITLYGGTVVRSIGYIAYQNRNTFTSGTEAYEYVWDIIHAVYGDIYDEEYAA